jgi:16S rRNA (guanine966-N2)-methyltransferase
MTLKIIGGEFGGRLLKTPKGDATRPTTSMARQAIFNRCQHQIEGARVLDLFAGSGAIGFEALSRGATFVTFVDSHKQAIACIKENAKILHIEEKCQVLQMQVAGALSLLKEPYDLIYIDPPYDLPVLELLEEIGKKKILKTGGILFFEERFKKNPPPHLSHLSYVDSRRYGEALIHQYHNCSELP